MTERKNYDVSLSGIRPFEDAVGSLPPQQRTLIQKREEIAKDKKYKEHAIFVDYLDGRIKVLPHKQDSENYWVTVFDYDEQRLE